MVHYYTTQRTGTTQMFIFMFFFFKKTPHESNSNRTAYGIGSTQVMRAPKRLKSWMNSAMSRSFLHAGVFLQASVFPEWTSTAWSWTSLLSPSWTFLLWRDSNWYIKPLWWPLKRSWDFKKYCQFFIEAKLQHRLILLILYNKNIQSVNWCLMDNYAIIHSFFLMLDTKQIYNVIENYDWIQLFLVGT